MVALPDRGGARKPSRLGLLAAAGIAGRLGLVSPLEQASLALGEQLRRAEFGQRLQELHPSRRADDRNFSALAGYEVNSAPAIRRTLQTLFLTELAGEPLSLSDDDRAYIAWITQAWRAIQRIAGRCWVPMRSELRT